MRGTVPLATGPAVRFPTLGRILRRPAFREAVAAYCFLLPGLIPMIAFFLVPIVGGLFFSFLNWNLLQPWKFVGLGNYVALVTDKDFWGALRVSATYMVGVAPIGMIQ